MATRPQESLGSRERQIMDAVHQLSEGSVGDVRQRLADPPSYSSVRTMLRLLEQKGFLRHRREGTKYVYRPTEAPEKARRSALRRVLDVFFGGSLEKAVAAHLSDPSGRAKIGPQELEQLAELIEAAKKKGS
jgi:predicted transcriptional regulator